MDQNQSITAFQANLILITSVGFMNHVLIEPVLFEKAGRDAWISSVLAAFLLFAAIPLIRFVMDRTGEESVQSWLRNRFGTTTAVLLSIPVIVYLLSVCAISMKDSLDWLKIAYLPQTPDFLIVFILMLLCVLSANSGLRTIAIMTGVLLPFVLLYGYFVALANMTHKHYSFLLPVFEHGVRPAVHGTLYAWGGLIEIVLIVWMKHHISSPVRTGSLLLLALLLAGLTIGPITGAVAAFGPFEAMKQRYPAYEQWRLVQIGKYIEHVDFLSLYQWLVGAVIRIAVALFLVLDMLNLKSKASRVRTLVLVSGAISGFSLLPFSDSFFISSLSNYYLPLSAVFTAAYLLITGFLIGLARRKANG
jgi:spore germination protein (amino acid permease)